MVKPEESRFIIWDSVAKDEGIYCNAVYFSAPHAGRMWRWAFIPEVRIGWEP